MLRGALRRVERNPYAALAAGWLAFLGVWAWLLTGGSAPAAGQPDTDLTQRGRQLFVESCASCHGDGGAGTPDGPSLLNAGAASADFMLRTGRMPLSDPGAQSARKPAAFTEDEIEALVAYVASLGSGPAIPAFDMELGDLPLGGSLFIENCAPCHGATGNGGAAGARATAPSLHSSSALDVAEALTIGPGQMPVFAFDDEELASLLVFVDHLQEQESPGGADLGQIGPVPEGYVAWGGMLILIGIAMIVGRECSR